MCKVFVTGKGGNNICMSIKKKKDVCLSNLPYSRALAVKVMQHNNEESQGTKRRNTFI